MQGSDPCLAVCAKTMLSLKFLARPSCCPCANTACPQCKQCCLYQLRLCLLTLFSWVQALNASDSDSDGPYQPAPGPVLYRLRADGRRVPITEGHGVNLAQRKGLMQEVTVSPRKVSQTHSDANPAFPAQSSSQPESVLLHSVELPQVQLGDPEVADSTPEGEAEAGGPSKGPQMGLPYSLQNLQAHPSLLQLQQRQQSQQPLPRTRDSQTHLHPSSGTHSAPLSGRPPHQASSAAHLSSLSSLSSEYLKASERESSSQAAAAALATQQASSWGLNTPHASNPAPGSGVESAASKAQHAAHMGHVGQAPGSHGAGLPRGPFGSAPGMQHNSAPLGSLEGGSLDYPRSLSMSVSLLLPKSLLPPCACNACPSMLCSVSSAPVDPCKANM